MHKFKLGMALTIILVRDAPYLVSTIKLFKSLDGKKPSKISPSLQLYDTIDKYNVWQHFEQHSTTKLTYF